jgi:hypothetical protein
MLSKEELKSLLDSLGDTPEEIATNLTHKCIMGSIAMANSCPIANYLRQETGRRAFVDSDRIVLFGSESYADLQLNVLSYQLQYFIANFDTGKYPLLIDSPVNHPKENS